MSYNVIHCHTLNKFVVSIRTGWHQTASFDVLPDAQKSPARLRLKFTVVSTAIRDLIRPVDHTRWGARSEFLCFSTFHYTLSATPFNWLLNNGKMDVHFLFVWSRNAPWIELKSQLRKRNVRTRTAQFRTADRGWMQMCNGIELRRHKSVVASKPSILQQETWQSYCFYHVKAVSHDDPTRSDAVVSQMGSYDGVRLKSL